MSTPTSPSAEAPKPAFGRQTSTSSTSSDGGEGQGGRARTSSLTDTRWRTASFSEPGRVVVVAVDASDNAKQSFEWYLENVHRGDDLIVLVHCPEAPRLPTFSFRSVKMAPPVEEWADIVTKMNETVKELEKEYEYICVSKKLRYKIRGESMKNPGEGICRIASEEKANLVVIGTRGLSSVKRAVLGSVSDYVVRNSGVPTLIVPKGKK